MLYVLIFQILLFLRIAIFVALKLNIYTYNDLVRPSDKFWSLIKRKNLKEQYQIPIVAK
jgi:hypothetical protein